VLRPAWWSHEMRQIPFLMSLHWQKLAQTFTRSLLNPENSTNVFYLFQTTATQNNLQFLEG